MQVAMTRRVIGARRRPLEDWLPWWRRTYRFAGRVVSDLSFDLVESARSRIHRMAGHAARLPVSTVTCTALHWRSQAWWRKRQSDISAGLTFLRRPSPGQPRAWETPLELCHGKYWFDIAQDRTGWRNLESSFVAL